MKVTVEEINASQKKLEITVPAKEVGRRLEEQMGLAMQRVTVKGFRPGKAPRGLIERQYGSYVRSQVAALIMEEQTKKAIEEQDLKPVASPVMAPGKIEEGKDFTFVANVEVMPPVELKEYKGVEVVRPTATVSDEDVEKAIAELRTANATLKKPEPERPVIKGDILTLELDATSKGAKISHEHDFKIEVGAGVMPAEFEDALIGLKPADKKHIVISYPAEAQHALSGQEVSFDVVVKDIQEKILPELDDEFAKDLGRESLEDLKSHIRSEILKARQDAHNRRAHESILMKLIELHPLDLPPSLVARQKELLAEELKRRFQSSGMRFDESRFEKEVLEKAREKIHADILLKAIAEKENISATDEEIDKRIKEFAQSRGQDYEKFKDAIVAQDKLDTIRFQLRDEKTLDFLLNNAIIKEEEPEAKSDRKPKSEGKKKPAPKKKKRAE